MLRHTASRSHAYALIRTKQKPVEQKFRSHATNSQYLSLCPSNLSTTVFICSMVSAARMFCLATNSVTYLPRCFLLTLWYTPMMALSWTRRLRSHWCSNLRARIRRVSVSLFRVHIPPDGYRRVSHRHRQLPHSPQYW